MDLAYLFTFITGSLGIFLLILTYTYIDKLEKIGCACADHPYRNFIKKYCLFAIAFILLSILFPPALAGRVLGLGLGTVYMLVKVLFGIASIVFFVLALIYVRYLMREKCKCSEDIRREVLYVWSIVEIVIVAAAVVVPTMIGVSGGAFMLLRSSVIDGSKRLDGVFDSTVNPVGAAKKVPGNLKKIAKSLRLRK